MSGLPSAGGGYGARHHHHHHHHLGLPDVVSEFLAPTAASTGGNSNKRKRRPAGTPDPDAEVVALSPKTLMESDRYVCEICNQGFQRDQNLQMHRRRHKVPWKLLKKPSTLGTNKRVYICPERSCLHHDPTHALGDLVGIKKHYRRKHCTEKQWKCVKCSKRYAVQSDYKAHLKTCGTRGHCCECGRVFSRVESFIEHQDTCGAAKHKHSGGAASERKPPPVLLHQDITDRISLDSRSQSSDTTQALPFAQQSRMTSDTAGDNSSHAQPAAEDVDRHHSQRVLTLEAQQPAYNNNAAALPAWLMDLRGNKMERQLQSSLASSVFPGVRRVVIGDHSAYSSAVCLTESKPATTLPENHNTPSLSLSIGRTGSVDQATTSIESMPCLKLSIGPSTAAETAASSCPSQYADTKPAACFGSRESIASRESFASDTQAAALHDFLAQAWRPCAMQGCGSR